MALSFSVGGRLPAVLCGHQLKLLLVGGLTATAVFDGPINNPTFLAYVGQVLVPTLRPGNVVVLDNLPMHRQPEVQAAIEAVGSRLRPATV